MRHPPAERAGVLIRGNAGVWDASFRRMPTRISAHRSVGGHGARDLPRGCGSARESLQRPSSHSSCATAGRMADQQSEIQSCVKSFRPVRDTSRPNASGTPNLCWKACQAAGRYHHRHIVKVRNRW